MDNNVKKFRKQANLTQRQLAKAARTSQQQIQRIETGAVSARADLAAALAATFGVALEDLFPALKKITNRQRTTLSNTEKIQKYAEAGVDVDPRIWTVRLQLKGHQNAFAYVVPSAERTRLEQWIGGGGDEIVVFDTNASSILLNLRHLVYAHFLFDTGISADTNEMETVRVFFDGLAEPFIFQVDEDRGTPGAEDDEGEFRSILMSDGLTVEDLGGKGARFMFTDVDGERVYLRAADVALMEVPLWVTQGEREDFEDEESDDEDEGIAASDDKPSDE